MNKLFTLLVLAFLLVSCNKRETCWECTINGTYTYINIPWNNNSSSFIICENDSVFHGMSSREIENEIAELEQFGQGMSCEKFKRKK